MNFFNRMPLRRKLRLVPGLLRLDLLQLGPQGVGVDLRQYLAGLDVLALNVVDPFQLAVEPRLHGHGGPGLDGADADQKIRDIFPGHAHERRRHGNRCLGRCRRLAPG